MTLNGRIALPTYIFTQWKMKEKMLFEVGFFFLIPLPNFLVNKSNGIKYRYKLPILSYPCEHSLTGIIKIWLGVDQECKL